MQLKQSEHDIQSVIINYLQAKGWYVMRLNSGKMPYEYKGKRGMVHMLPVGTPDLMAFKDPYQAEGGVDLLFIEVKAGKNKPTDLQTMRMKELERYGAKCMVAYGVEDLEKAGI